MALTINPKGLKGFKLLTPIWVSVDERLPEDYVGCFLKYVYRNGNSGDAMGYYKEDDKEWEIEHSDDHPMTEDIKYWLDEVGIEDLKESFDELNKSLDKLKKTDANIKGN